jgi:hypothetical protein
VFDKQTKVKEVKELDVRRIWLSHLSLQLRVKEIQEKPFESSYYSTPELNPPSLTLTLTLSPSNPQLLKTPNSLSFSSPSSLNYTGPLTRTSTIDSAELELANRQNYLIVPSYSEAILLDPLQPNVSSHNPLHPNLFSPISVRKFASATIP